LSDGKEGPGPEAVWHYPHGATVDAESTDAAPDGSIRIQFSRFLAADTANRQSFCIQAFTNGPNSGTEHCLTAGSGPGDVTISVEYDPVDRVVVLKPQKALDPGRYNIRVIPPKTADDANGLRAFDGVPLAKEYSFAMTVVTGGMAKEPKRKVDFCAAPYSGCDAPKDACTAPSKDTGFSTKEYIQQSCGTEANCHLASTKPLKTEFVGATLLFDDADNGGVQTALKRIIQNQLVPPESAVDPDPGVARVTDPTTFARNMPYIDPHNPANSFMLYKVIMGQLRCPETQDGDNAVTGYCQGDKYPASLLFGADVYDCTKLPAPMTAAAGAACPPFDPGAAMPIYTKGNITPYLAEPWVPDTEWKPPILGEYNRLRLHVRGNPMPSPAGGEGPVNLHLLSAWIAAGAPVTDCPSQ
jgi:hypothetical protein